MNYLGNKAASSMKPFRSGERAGISAIRVLEIALLESPLAWTCSINWTQIPRSESYPLTSDIA